MHFNASLSFPRKAVCRLRRQNRVRAQLARVPPAREVMAPAPSEQDQKDARLPEQSAALGLRGTASRISGKLSRKDTGLAALANI